MPAKGCTCAELQYRNKITDVENSSSEAPKMKRGEKVDKVRNIDLG